MFRKNKIMRSTAFLLVLVMMFSLCSVIGAAEDDMFSIAYGESAGGTVIGPVSAKAGEKVNITAIPENDYYLSSLKVNDTAITGNSFTMPEGNVTVTAEFLWVIMGYKSITYALFKNGDVTGPRTGGAGLTINLTVVPVDGYRLVEGSLKLDGNPIDGNSFVMPEAHVTITAEFEPMPEPPPIPEKVTITAFVADKMDGRISISGGSSNVLNASVTIAGGASASLTATPIAYRDFDGWYEGEKKVSSARAYTFTAERDYTLEARFTVNLTRPATGTGTVWGDSVYNIINVNDVEIKDTPRSTSQTTYPGEFPKELLDLPQKTDEEIQAIINALLPVMTFEEKVRMLGLSDSDPDGRDGVGWLIGIPRLGVPELRFNDGPAGISMTKSYRETTNPPNQNVISSTWDPKYAYMVGQIYGTEHRSIGLGYQLGTQYDLIRTPIWHRAKDTFGEDYYLSGTMAAGMTDGVQENGGLAMSKHIGAYATCGDTLLWIEVDEQTYQQAYMVPFESAAKKAQVSSIMSTYNRLNGYYTASNYYQQVETLRNMWGWKGAMVPDWGSNQEFSMMLGTDVSQDSYSNLRSKILRAIGYGNLTWERVDEAVAHSLYSFGVGGFLNLVEIDPLSGLAKEDTARSSSSSSTRIKFTDTYTEDRANGLLKNSNALALEVAEKGMILLKNEKNALPIESGSVALLGMGTERLFGGTGGERSFGVLEYMLTPKEVFTKNYKGQVTSAITTNPFGVTVPASALFQDAEGTVPGLKRNDGKIDTTIEYLYEKGFFRGGDALTRGTTYTWTGYIQIPADIHSFVAQANGGSFSYNIQARTTSGGSYTISGSRSGGVDWDNYTAEGLNFTANNVTTRNIAAGLYPITITANANDTQRDHGFRLAWITTSRQAADLQAARTAAAENDTVIYFVRQGRTGHSPVPVTDFNMYKLPDGSYSNADGDTNHLALIKEMAAIAHNNGNKFVLVVCSPTAFSFDGDWLDSVDSLIAAYSGGQSYATALYNIITGAVNPSGKTTSTYPKTMYDTLLSFNDDVKNIRLGVQGQNATRTAKYTEGLNFGYRWYDSEEAKNSTVIAAKSSAGVVTATKVGAEYQYPFGYGLSYTTFAYSNLKPQFDPATNEVKVSFDLKNTGNRTGTEIAQVYIGPADLGPGKEYVQQVAKQLAGFKRVEDIKPGETVNVNITVEERMLSYWDIGIPDDALVRARDGSYGKWVIPDSEREIMVGGSSNALVLSDIVGVNCEITSFAIAGIYAPDILFASNMPSLSYGISVKNVTKTNLIEVAAKFDVSKLTYIGSAIDPSVSDMLQFFGTPTFNKETGEYKATIAVLQEATFFKAEEFKRIIAVNFVAAASTVNKDRIVGELTSTIVYELQPDMMDVLMVNAKRDPSSVLTIFTIRFDFNGDGKIDMRDISLIIANYYLNKVGGAKWEQAKQFDANSDGIIDIADLLIICTFFS